MKFACFRDGRAPGSEDRSAGKPALVLAAALLLSFHPGPARAIDAGLCNDDGVTEVPAFADGRDANQCLLIDPGNGDAPIRFQYEFFRETGDTTSVSINKKCPTQDQNEGCTYLLHEVTVDNYLSQDARNEDIWKTSIDAEYILIKDSRFINGWKCAGGNWSGPNGLSCSSDSSAHSDGIQMRRNPVDGGWVIFQDSVLSNAFNATCRFTDGPRHGAVGSYMFQGFQLGQFSTPLGEAENYIQDCKDRGGNDQICEVNECIIQAGGNSGLKELWFIDVWGVTPMKLNNGHQKVVVVNTGCGRNGCGGSIEFDNGWPWPLGAARNSGPGVCPNGLITQEPAVSGYDTDAVFCYTSIEAALNDTPTASANQGDCPSSHCPHKPPPFIHLSATGWENPPDGTSRRPAAPFLLP